MKITPQPGKIEIKGIVRDQDGNPKFDSADGVKKFWDLLSDDDKAHLVKQFNLNMEK